MSLYMPRNKWIAPNVYRTYCHECCSSYDATCKTTPFGIRKVAFCRTCHAIMAIFEPTDFKRSYRMVKSRRYWEPLGPAAEPDPYFNPPRPTLAELRKSWGLEPKNSDPPLIAPVGNTSSHAVQTDQIAPITESADSATTSS